MDEKRKIFVKTLLPFVNGTLLAVLTIGAFIFVKHPYIVKGTSMYPTYKNGALVFCVRQAIYAPGDVVIVKHKSSYLIKRICGTPGDHVVIKDGVLYLNDEQFCNYDVMYTTEDMDIFLGNDEYFILGDNRNDSCDSRDFGPIKYKQIKYLVYQTIIKGDE